jgi:hypothetical protein
VIAQSKERPNRNTKCIVATVAAIPVVVEFTLAQYGQMGLPFHRMGSRVSTQSRSVHGKSFIVFMLFSLPLTGTDNPGQPLDNATQMSYPMHIEKGGLGQKCELPS